MLTARRILAGIAAVAAALALVVGLLAVRSGGPRNALALSPTPVPFNFLWETDTIGNLIEGQTLKLSAEALPVTPALGSSYGATINEPVYSLSIQDAATSPVELTGPADVPVASFNEDASWELRARHEGQATLELSVRYRLSYNITGTPPGSYQASSYTTQVIDVAGLAPGDGDMNGDGMTNAIDAALTLQYQAGLICSLDDPCPLPDRTNGDVNLDGVTNAIDAALILQFTAALVHRLPHIPMPPVDVQPTVQPNGLEIYEIETGDGAQVMTLNDTITVNYTGWLEDGTMFDTTRRRGPTTFPLTTVIAGWRQGVLGMRAGGLRRVTMPPELAYGSQGSDGIPPDATLIFDIELVSVP
jgi:hypothetical protein